MAKDKSMTEQDLTKYVIAILEEADKGFQDACAQWETRFSQLEEKCDARFDKIEARLAEIEEHLPNLARGKDIKGSRSRLGRDVLIGPGCLKGRPMLKKMSNEEFFKIMRESATSDSEE